MRLGNEHVMGVYLIWKFAKNKEAAQKYVVDQQLGYQDHFVRSKFYNFPPWTNAIKGGFKDDPHSWRRRTRTSRGASTRSSRRSPRSTRRIPAIRATRRR